MRWSRALPVHHHNWSVAVVVAALMNIDNEVIDAARIGHFRPTGTVQHPDIELVVVLHRLDDKVPAHIIRFVHLTQELNTIVIAADGRRIVRPKLSKILQRNESN